MYIHVLLCDFNCFLLLVTPGLQEDEQRFEERTDRDIEDKVWH